MITGIHHPVVKSLRSILQKQGKAGEPYFLVEGVKLVKEALSSDADVHRVFFTEHFLVQHEKTSRKIFDECKKKQISFEKLSDAAFGKVSTLEHSDGILAQVKKKKYGFSDVEKKKDGTIVVLEEIQDPGNVGTILRLCEAFNASAVLMGKGCASLYNPKVLRASMGALFHLHCISGDVQTFFKWLRENKFKIILADIQGKKAVYETTLTGRCALVFGNESRGFSRWFFENADESACIPQHGKLNSINVAWACAIFLYERMRQQIAVQRPKTAD